MSVHRTRLTRTRPTGTASPERTQRPEQHRVDRRRAPLGSRLLARLAADRGDVPGWVMITLMTAAIVVALWAVASEQLVAIFQNALRPFQGTEL